MPPKILIGCPTAEEKAYCLDEYIQGLRDLTWKNAEFIIVDNSPTQEYAERMRAKGLRVINDVRLDDVKERIAHSRKMIRDLLLKGDYDYFLSLEQDVIPPPDLIERMLSAQVSVITGVYFTAYKIDNQIKMRPLVWKAHSDSAQMTFMNEEVRAAKGKIKNVVPVRASGLGVMLIHRNVLEKIPFRAVPESFDDMPFCQDLAKAGIQLYADLTIVCKHLVKFEGQVLVLPP